jgi:hypothetical protein
VVAKPAAALGVEITERLESMPELIDRLDKRLG